MPRSRGRRVPNIARRLLITLGVASLVGGPLFGLVLAPRWDAVPNTLPARQVAEGRGTYLVPNRGYRVVGPVRLRNIHRIQPRPADAGSGAVVWAAGDRTVDLDHDRLVDHATTVYALDRRTARSVECCGIETNRHGALTQAFPPGTKPASYPWWDETAQRVFPARFAGRATVDGVPVYVFGVRVAPLGIDRVQVPRAAVGSDAAGQVALDWWYASTTRLWVEPDSGVIVRGTQTADQWLADGAGRRRLTVATTTFTDTPATVRANLAVARQIRAEQQARRTWPVAVGPLLALVLLAGLAVRWDLTPTPEASPEAEPAPGSSAARAPPPRTAPRVVMAWQPEGPNELLERRPA
jgi:Porin PorA